MAKANPTCSVQGCGKKPKARSFCVSHYARWRRTGSPTRNCSGCGEVLATQIKGNYCGVDCKPRCDAPGCTKPKHYITGYCSNHHQIFERHGKPEGVRKWTHRADEYECVVCAAVFPHGGRYRKFCSAGCQMVYQWYEDVPSLDFDCAVCGCRISWDSAPKKWRRRDKKICDRCRNIGRTRHKTQPAFLADRDGLDCGLCGKPVNMESRYPAPDSASVDHIIPVSLGGTHDEDNLQLTHWKCNHSKRNKPHRTVT